MLLRDTCDNVKNISKKNIPTEVNTDHKQIAATQKQINDNAVTNYITYDFIEKMKIYFVF